MENFEDITEIDVKRCIEERSTRKPGDFEVASVEKAVAKVQMKMSISGAEDRSNILLLDYKRALESAGYGKFPLECPKLAIRHIHERLKPPILKEMVED